MAEEDEKIIVPRAFEARFNEVQYDKQAARQVYDFATTKYHNSLIRMAEFEQRLWNDISEVLGLDQSIKWRCDYDMSERRHVITKAPGDNKSDG